MEYQIGLKPCAARDFSKLAQAVREAVGVVIDSLKKNPRPLGVRRLCHNKDLYRVRIRDHRIIYNIDDKSHILLIVAVGPRSKVYRKI
jgi:mRNA interferase RelE/StbE